MFRHGLQQFLSGVMKDLYLPLLIGISGVQLPQHLYHHIVGGFIDKGNQHLLAVDGKVSLPVPFHCRLGNLPDKIPGQRLRQSIPQCLHISLIDIAGLGGTHIRNGIIMPAERAFFQKLGNDFLLLRRVKPDLATPQSVLFMGKKFLQGNHKVFPGQIGGNVIRIGDADIGRGIGGNVGDHIIVYFPIIRIQTQIHPDIGIQRLEIIDCPFINPGLGLIGIVFGPESDFILSGIIKFPGYFISRKPLGAMASSKPEHTACQNHRPG